jgi:AraC-type DNA-binding domain-containing proteins
MEELKNQIAELLMQKGYHVSIYRVGTIRFHEGFRMKNHSHKEYEINYINSGYCVMEVEGIPVYLKQGDCLFISPGVRHGFIVDARKACSVSQAEFSVTIPKHFEATIPFFTKKKAYYRIQDCPEIRCIIESIHRCERYTVEQEMYNELMKFSFAQLYMICSYYQEKKGDCKRFKILDRTEEVIQYIEQNYADKLELEELAKKFQISSRYIRRQILEKRGMTCSRYITMLRIGKAKKMLYDRSYSMTEIAVQSGFGTSQYFCRVFSRLEGMSPTQFRNLCRKGERENE